MLADIHWEDVHAQFLREQATAVAGARDATAGRIDGNCVVDVDGKVDGSVNGNGRVDGRVDGKSVGEGKIGTDCERDAPLRVAVCPNWREAAVKITELRGVLMRHAY